MARQWTHVTSVLCVLIKFLGNLSLRFGQIYAIFFAEAIGVSTGAFLNAIGFAEFAGLIAGLFAPLFDVFNPRKMFCVGEVLALVGFALAYLDKTSLLGVGAAWFIFLGGGAVIASAVQAALSKADLGASLAFVTSTIESSWSFAGLLGIPMVGLILKQGSWELLFGLMFCLHAPIGTLLAWQFLGPETAGDAVVAPAATAAAKSHTEIEMAASTASAADSSSVADETLVPVVPAGDHTGDTSAEEKPPPPEHSCANVCSASLSHFGFIFTNRRTFVTIIYSALMSYTQNLPAAAMGQWLRLQHGYDAEAVGWISFVMGGGEMIGLLLVASLSARVGLERSVWTGATLMVLSQIGMGVAQHFGLVPGLVMIFFCFVTGEFTFVASIAFASSGAIVTESVGTLMGLFFCSFNVGAMMSAFSVTPVYDRFGMAGSAAASATAMLTGALMLRYALRGCGGGCGDEAQAAAAAAPVAPAVGAEKESPPTVVLVDEKGEVAAIDGAASEPK